MNSRRIPFLLHCYLSIVVALALAVPSACTAENAIFNALVGPGVEISANETLQLPKPALADGIPANQVRPTIESLLAGKYDWETFSRKSIVSPFLLKISEGTTESGPITRHIDIYFIAYGSLDLLKQEDYLNKQLNLAGSDEQSGSSDKAKMLTSDDLRERRITLGTNPTDPRWVALNSTLLAKVLLHLTTQNIKTESTSSIIIASIVDPRFTDDAEYPNSWQSLTTDDTGQRQTGPAEPYVGLASYAKATQLANPSGAIFMEYHVVFIEPQGWFNGTNLLRSKLPLVAQDMVRKFRRTLNE